MAAVALLAFRLCCQTCLFGRICSLLIAGVYTQKVYLRCFLTSSPPSPPPSPILILTDSMGLSFSVQQNSLERILMFYVSVKTGRLI